LEACRINVSGAEEKWGVKLKVVFRVDSSYEIGTGHVMRCLTLAQVLKENGANVKFICRKHKGNLIDKVYLSGFRVYELEILKEAKVDNKLAHSHLLETTQQQDADDCIDILKAEKIDWLIVDHYALDRQWQNRLRPYYEKLMVIDDLADRQHQCDILLDQTFGRQQKEYLMRTPKGCQLLLGSQYALLRPDFYKWREFSLKRRAKPEFKNLLVNMGGIDRNNRTGEVLQELQNCVLPRDTSIIILMGNSAPYIEDVRIMADALPYKTEIRINVNNMAEIMANADLAIGAAGSTTWERCCMGLPTIQIMTADNQIQIVKNLDSINAIQFISSTCHLSKAFDKIFQFINKISLVSSSLVDGKGSLRILELIKHKKNNIDSFYMKPVDFSENQFVYGLQTKVNRQFFINPEVPSIEEHTKWFQEAVKSSISQLFILVQGSSRVGILRVDNIKNSTLEVSVIILKKYIGKGFAKKALRDIEGLNPGKNFLAIIHNNNTASKNLFLKIGYILTKCKGEFNEYKKIL